MKRILLSAMLAVAVAALLTPATFAQEHATLIKNATVLTVTRGTIENGDVLIRNGKIAAVGKNLKPPAGATVIDATGMYLLPGIIDRSEEHTSELQSQSNLVCRLLL